MTPQHPTIGGLLRSLRARKGWTLKQMSEHSGIPLSTLSKVEHDRLTLSYDKLLQLAQRLQLRMSELFAEEAEAPEPAVTARRSIGRIEDAIGQTYVYSVGYLTSPPHRTTLMTIGGVHARQRALLGIVFAKHDPADLFPTSFARNDNPLPPDALLT